MAELRACFESLGFHNVRSYIQSGNVVFGTDEQDQAALASQIEAGLTGAFGLELLTVVRSQDAMRAVIDQAPAGFGAQPDDYRYDVVFLKEPLTPDNALEQISTRDGVDHAHSGPGAIYFSRLTSRASQSHLSRVVSLPIYQSMTIRNWRTTTRLMSMLEEGA
jgi:uncharacterized protein (DUF1697 family)